MLILQGASKSGTILKERFRRMRIDIGMRFDVDPRRLIRLKVILFYLTTYLIWQIVHAHYMLQMDSHMPVLILILILSIKDMKITKCLVISSCCTERRFLGT